jgi:hypothetical protein
MSAHAELTIDRPVLPEGYGVPTSDEGLLAWDVVRARLEQAKNYWITTASVGGRPHAVPLWGAWVNDRFYFDGALDTRWGRNLTKNPQVVVHLESGSEVAIIEGTFFKEGGLDPDAFAKVQAQYTAKYESYAPEHAEGMYMVRPRKALAWATFPKDMTRFTFPR